jgi:transcriptional regulator with XRE-family HTH domain
MFDLNSSQVSQWASGARRPKLDTILMILPTLKVTMQYIYIGDDTGLDYETRMTLAALEREEAESEAAAGPDVTPKAHGL